MEADEFARHVMTRTSRMFKLKSKDLPLFDGNIVYMALGSSQVLYVGLSTTGLARVFRRDHHIISKINKEIVSIQVYETETEESARTLEATLIREFKPKFNSRGKPKGSLGSARVISMAGF